MLFLFNKGDLPGLPINYPLPVSYDFASEDKAMKLKCDSYFQ